MTLEQRIEALEKRCKRLGKTLVGVGTLALFAVVAGTAGWTAAYTGKISPSSITTEKIFLKDKAGKTRIILIGSSILAMYDKAGKTRVTLHGGSGSLSMKDKAGKTRVSLYGNNGTVRAYDPTGMVRVTLDGGIGQISFKTLNADKSITTIYHP